MTAQGTPPPASDATPARPPPLGRIVFLPSRDDVARRGRLGTLAFEVGGLHLDGVQLRRSATGRVYLSFRHAEVRPVDDDARLTLEIAVIAALRLRPEEAAS